jgi:hypothetical protein
MQKRARPEERKACQSKKEGPKAIENLTSCSCLIALISVLTKHFPRDDWRPSLTWWRPLNQSRRIGPE